MKKTLLTTALALGVSTNVVAQDKVKVGDYIGNVKMIVPLPFIIANIPRDKADEPFRVKENAYYDVKGNLLYGIFYQSCKENNFWFRTAVYDASKKKYYIDNKSEISNLPDGKIDKILSRENKKVPLKEILFECPSDHYQNE